MLAKIMSFFSKTSTEGLMRMTPEQHERHTKINRGIDVANGVYGDLLDDMSPEDPDSPGVLTVEELGARVLERLGARAGK